MVPLQLPIQRETGPGPAVSAGAWGLINHLRFVAMQCRVKRRASLFEACATLHVTRAASRDAYAEALMRSMAEALGQPAKLHGPGTQELTFDELWLIQLAQSAAVEDQASLSFLLRARVARENRRLVLFLVHHIVEYFDLN